MVPYVFVKHWDAQMRDANTLVFGAKENSVEK